MSLCPSGIASRSFNCISASNPLGGFTIEGYNGERGTFGYEIMPQKYVEEVLKGFRYV